MDESVDVSDMNPRRTLRSPHFRASCYLSRRSLRCPKAVSSRLETQSVGVGVSTGGQSAAFQARGCDYSSANRDPGENPDDALSLGHSGLAARITRVLPAEDMRANASAAQLCVKKC